MRGYAAVFVVAAAVALAGCSSSEPNSPVDPEKAESSDYVVPSIIVGVAAITGCVLLGALLIVRRRRRKRTARADPAPPGKETAKGP